MLDDDDDDARDDDEDDEEARGWDEDGAGTGGAAPAVAEVDELLEEATSMFEG